MVRVATGPGVKLAVTVFTRTAFSAGISANTVMLPEVVVVIEKPADPLEFVRIEEGVIRSVPPREECRETASPDIGFPLASIRVTVMEREDFPSAVTSEADPVILDAVVLAPETRMPMEAVKTDFPLVARIPNEVSPSAWVGVPEIHPDFESRRSPRGKEGTTV